MKLNRSMAIRFVLLIAVMMNLTILSSKIQADTGSCGGVTVTLPFTDVMTSPFFCQIAAAYFSGLTNGTTATTYSPGNVVTREQMAAFTTRTQDSALRRGSRRAALSQWARLTVIPSSATTTVGASPQLVRSDGADLWVANGGGTVSRVRASDGKLLDTWTGATSAFAVLVARGRIFVTGSTFPNGQLYSIDPSQPGGPVSTVANNLGANPNAITTDGTFIWTAGGGSVSRLNPDTGEVMIFTSGFQNAIDILYDGANIWVTDNGTSTLFRLNADGSIAQTVAVGTNPNRSIFDGTNIWVTNREDSSLSVVRAVGSLAGTGLATLTGNGLNAPTTAAFDGQRILITNLNGNSVSLWNAADLTPLGSVSTGTQGTPKGACSDGINFWITLNDTNKLARL